MGCSSSVPRAEEAKPLPPVSKVVTQPAACDSTAVMGKQVQLIPADVANGQPGTPVTPEKPRLFTKTESLKVLKRGVCGLMANELPNGKVLKYNVDTLIGHAKAVKCCAIAPDELKMATACARDRVITLWDIVTSKVMMKLDGHDDGVVCCAFSADARLLASGSLDNSLAVWDSSTGKILFKLFGHQFLVCSCSFSRDGTLIVSGSGDNSLIIWSVKTGLPLGTLEGHTKIVTCCSFSPDGNYILSSSGDRTIVLWETKGGEKFKQVKAHFDVVLSCCYNMDGSRIISNDKRTLKVWDSATCTQLFAMPIQPSSLSPSVLPDGATDPVKGGMDRRFVVSAFSPDGRNIVFCSNDRTVTVWDPDGGQEVLCLYTRQSTVAMAVGPCNLVAFGDEGGNIYVLRLVTPVQKKAVVVVQGGVD